MGTFHEFEKMLGYEGVVVISSSKVTQREGGSAVVIYHISNLDALDNFLEDYSDGRKAVDGMVLVP